MTITTVAARCVDQDCNCLDRNGVILYQGDDMAQAETARQNAPHGYEVEVDVRPA